MSDNNANKLKLLKQSLQVREKELLAVFKELDHYRRKCNKLKLLLLKQKSEKNTQNIAVETSEQILQKSEIKSNNTAEESTKKIQKTGEHSIKIQEIKQEDIPIQDSNIEEGEINEISKIKQPQIPTKRKRKTAVTKFMESIASVPSEISLKNNQNIKKPIEKMQESIGETDQPSLETIQKFLQNSNPVNKNKPNLRQRQGHNQNQTNNNIAYNKPYSMGGSYTEINYNSLAQQPVQYTPMTINLSQINPETTKFKEYFEINKKLYCSGNDFNLTNLSVLADILKSIEPSAAASYFVNEMMQSSYLFSPADALSIIYGVLKEIIGSPQ